MTCNPIDSEITLSYLICATPRTGSNFLCEVLRATGLAGRPDDYFWNPTFWYERWNVSGFSTYLSRLLREGTGDNDVFGCKMMWDYLGDLLPQLAARVGSRTMTPQDMLAATFPNLHYVWLTREDKVRQGISYYRALETKVWRSTDMGQESFREPPFNALAIQSLVQLCTWEDQAWSDYFQDAGVTPLRVTYEELVNALESVVERILTFLDLPSAPPLQDRVCRHQRQADVLTEEWVHLYLTAMEQDPQEGQPLPKVLTRASKRRYRSIRK